MILRCCFTQVLYCCRLLNCILHYFTQLLFHCTVSYFHVSAFSKIGLILPPEIDSLLLPVTLNKRVKLLCFKSIERCRSELAGVSLMSKLPLNV